MKGTGLANDPAFENLHFLNEPIPPMEKKTILGLYFPEGRRAPEPIRLSSPVDNYFTA